MEKIVKFRRSFKVKNYHNFKSFYNMAFDLFIFDRITVF